MFKVNNIRAGFGIPPRGVVKVHLFFTDNKHVTCFRLKGPNLMCYCFIPYTSLNLGFFEFLRNEDWYYFFMETKLVVIEDICFSLGTVIMEKM